VTAEAGTTAEHEQAHDEETPTDGPVRAAGGRARHAGSGSGLFERSVHPGLWWTLAIVLTLAAIAGSILLGGHRRDNPTFDVADESAHYAYVVSLRSGHIPRWGDTLTPAEREMVDCLQAIGVPPVRCGATPPPASHYAAGGYDYEAQQPPLGYIPFVLAANPNAPPDQAIAAARHGGMIWVGISGVLLLLFIAVEGLSLLALTGLLATCLLDPVFTYAAATVNNDAAGVAAGALALLAWSLSRRIGWSIWLGLGAGVLIGLTKGLFVVVPFALVAAAVVQDWRTLASRSGWWEAGKRNVCVLAMFVASVVAYVGFTAVQGARAIVPSSVVLHALLSFTHVGTLQPSTVSTSATNILSLFQPYYQYDAINAIWGVCAFGVLVGVWVLEIPAAVAARVRGMSLGVLLGLVALLIGWPVLVFVQGHYNFPAAQRYGIPLLPLVGYVIVRGCRRFGVVAVGVVLPVAAAILQLALAKY
jgi:hypothetical protein